MRDYAVSHKKLSELGFITPPSSSSSTSGSNLDAVQSNKALVAQSAFGVAVAAAVVILSYFYEINRKV